MVDYSRWDSLDVDGSDEETTPVSTSSQSGLDMARSMDKHVRRMTRTLERATQNVEEKQALNVQRIAANEERLADQSKSVKKIGKSLHRQRAQTDLAHQDATRNLLFASEADVNARHDKLKESEKLRSKVAMVEAQRRSLARDVEATGLEVVKIKVDISSLGCELAETRQRFDQQRQCFTEQARFILKNQLRDANKLVKSAQMRDAMRALCRAGRELAAREQTETVVVETNAMTSKTEDICRGSFLGCIECGAGAMAVRSLAVCAHCKLVHYCCREHQVAGWPAHKAACRQKGAGRAFGVLEHLIDAAERHAAST